jgi:hypothetical protein
MNSWINVSRYHLADRIRFREQPWALLAFLFGVNLATTAASPPDANAAATLPSLLAGFFAVFIGIGALMISRMLPLGLTLGVSRRTYYIGSTLLCLGLAAGYGLAFAMLQAVERATGGWGTDAHFFRVPHILAGPWALTWLTSFVLVTLMLAYGMWCGIIYRRWNYPGLLIFAAAHIVVLLAAALIITWVHAWSHVAHALTKLTAAGLTGLLAVLAAIVLAGGYATIRRVTV